MSTGFDYDNLTGRGPGRIVRALGHVLPGVARVQTHVAPYAAAWREHNLRVLAQPGPRWVALGDSMAQGVGAASYDGSWVSQLARRLDPPLPVVNLSATGARVDDVVEVQLPLLRELPGADPERDLVTVLIGSNDLFAGGRVRAGLPDAFARMVDALPDGAVVATLPQPRAAARAANVHLERASDRLVVVDMRTSGPSSWKGRLADDFFHPNDAGYAALADAFEPAVRRALRRAR